MISQHCYVLPGTVYHDERKTPNLQYVEPHNPTLVDIEVPDLFPNFFLVLQSCWTAVETCVGGT